MDIEIINSPYEDRYCENCGRCSFDEKTKMYRCHKHNCFIGKDRWCSDWIMEYRIYKFEK